MKKELIHMCRNNYYLKFTKKHEIKKYAIVFGLFLATFINVYGQNIEIPVAIHILRDDNGTNPSATFADGEGEIENLNKAYNYLGISFIKCSEQYVDKTEIRNQFDDGDDDQKLLLDPYCIANVVNIFITDLEGSGNGKAVFPYKQKDWVLIDIESLGKTTVVHELGHYFGLKHTYSGIEDDPTESLTIRDAEGSEGWKYGDFLIDTPLDPENRSDYDNNCEYIGNETDSNGDLFHPDGKNYMGKGHSTCRSRFSTGQEARILEYIKRYRYYLKCDKSTSNNNLTCANSTSVTSFPHNDDFDRSDVLDEAFWVQAREGDDMNWSNGPSTPSSSTGPAAAQSGQTFMYFESSLKYTGSDEAILLSPCYDLTKSTESEIEFYYHMYGRSIGKLNLDISVDNGNTWENIFTKSGQQQTSENDDWKKENISLSDYVGGGIQLRFRAIGTGSSKSDIAIDNVTVSANNNLSISDETLNKSFKVYPNPTGSIITIEGTNVNQNKPQVFNVLGQDVSSLVELVIMDGNMVKMDLSNLIGNLYYIKTGTQVSKILKE